MQYNDYIADFVECVELTMFISEPSMLNIMLYNYWCQKYARISIHVLQIICSHLQHN